MNFMKTVQKVKEVKTEEVISGNDNLILRQENMNPDQLNVQDSFCFIPAVLNISIRNIK